MSDFNPNARGHRASICVRACTGIPDEVLEDPKYSVKAELDSLDKIIETSTQLLQQRDELRTRLTALEEIATAVEADIDCGRPLEYNVDELRVELIRTRKVLGILPEQEQTNTLGLEDQPAVKFACGFCGAALDEKGNQLKIIPEGYNPDNYEKAACRPCAESEIEEQYQFVTREMALDAGDPSLEGHEV